MRALAGYLLRSYTVSQRYFGPFAGLVIAVMILYSYKPNPVMNSYAATAVILFIASAWMGLSFLNHEHPVHKQITAVHAGGAFRYTIAGMAALIFLTGIMSVLTVIYPLLAGRFAEAPGVYRLLSALAGHFLLGMLGISISLYLQASWVRKTSHASGLLLIILILAVAGTQISKLLEGPFQALSLLLPPAAPVMDAMMNTDTLPLSRLLLSYGHVLFYSLLLAGFYLYRSSRKDMNKN
ncbi:hypothetical protein [Paenibacillus donghaensis]|uniref:Uncharacterized protein n=1 Tax=Paenibacillus donghaensis TaxID=414771 RepID=A0A2Z2KLY6_9BACL|nr:hypothetical protein [Paenibacillus donghaensis]ASA22132.1 hypothetical protein B9T62_15895 [Paenibacillus donghaensis]